MLDIQLIIAIVLLFIAILYFLNDSTFNLVICIAIILSIPFAIVLVLSDSIVCALITEALVIMLFGYYTRTKTVVN